MKLRLSRIDAIRPSNFGSGAEISVEVDMTEGQMYDALQEFQERITEETWQRWVDETAKWLAESDEDANA